MRNCCADARMNTLSLVSQWFVERFEGSKIHEPQRVGLAGKNDHRNREIV